MFDLNQILSAALNAAVAEAVAPLVERIAVLERRIDTLSSQHVAIGERLAAQEVGAGSSQFGESQGHGLLYELDYRPWLG